MTVESASPELTQRRSEVAGVSRLIPGFWLTLALAATFLVYVPALHHYFFLDDFWHLLKASQTAASNLWRPWHYSSKDYASYWFASELVNHQSVHGFFRPLVTVLYWVGLHIWGASPAPFHAVNIAGQLLTVAVVFWIAYRLFDRGWAAGFAAAVFGLHPCQYETVEWIAANADVMMGLFSALAMASFLEYLLGDRRRRSLYVLTIVSMLLALCSKEMAGVLPVAFFAIECFVWVKRGRCSWRQRVAGWKGWMLILGIILAYGLWRLPSAVGIVTLHRNGNYMASFSSALLVPQVVLNFCFYMLHFLLLYPVWPMNFAALFGMQSWWIAPLWLGVLVAIAWGLGRLAGGARKEYWLGIAWLTLIILPFCILGPAQRIAHLPSVGFAIALTAVAVGLADRVERRRPSRILRIGAVVLLTVYATVTSTYVSMMGSVSSLVGRVVIGLEHQIHNAPHGTDVYVLNLWQPAWMFEHYFAVKYRGRDYHIHVLTFSPNMLPMTMRQDPGLVQRWFAALFPQQVSYKPISVLFTNHRSLRVSVKHGTFFHGLVEGELPVAPSAQIIGHTIDDGPFTATPTAGRNNAVTALTFHWKHSRPASHRIFVQWHDGHWRRLTPPPAWERPVKPPTP